MYDDAISSILLNSPKNVTAETAFNCKMHKNSFEGRTPPGPAGELTALPQIP